MNARLDILELYVSNVCNFVIIRKNAHLMPILDKGCNIGGSLACLNSGKCLSTGFCECKTGFLGATCAQREF